MVNNQLPGLPDVGVLGTTIMSNIQKQLNSFTMGLSDIGKVLALPELPGLPEFPVPGRVGRPAAFPRRTRPSAVKGPMEQAGIKRWTETKLE